MQIHALDTSGGMTIEMIEQALELLESSAQPDDIVLGFDTRIYNPTRVRDIASFVPQGGGGTWAQVVIDFAVAKGAESIVFYSDGWLHETSLDWKGIQHREIVVSGGPHSKSANSSEELNKLGFQIIR